MTYFSTSTFLGTPSSIYNPSSKNYITYDFLDTWTSVNNPNWKTYNGVISTRATQVANASNGEIAMTTISGSEWLLSNVTFDGVPFSVNSQETNPAGIFFKPDGTKMYIIGYAGDEVNPYTLSTPWDVTTASFDGTRFSVSSQEISPRKLFFKPDGIKMYVVGDTGDDINTYTLSTPWDVTTATFDGSPFSVSGQASGPISLFFKPDGLKMYVMGYNTLRVFSYTLSSAWDVSTATYDSVSFLFSAQSNVPTGYFFKPDGTLMYILDFTTKSVYVYTLSTAWDISTASYNNISYSVNSEDTTPRDIYIKPDGSKMYIVGDSSNDVNPYTLQPVSIAISTHLSMLISRSLAYTASNFTLTARLKLASPDNIVVSFGVTDTTTREHPFYLSDGTNTITGDAADTCGIGYDTQGTTSQWFVGGIKSGVAK